MITELVLWSLKYCVFSELHLLTEKEIEANGYGYLEKVIPLLCLLSNLMLNYVRCLD